MTDIQCLTYVVARYVGKELGISAEELIEEAKGYFKVSDKAPKERDINTPEIKKIYDMYPSKDKNNSNRSTGKCRNNRLKIAILLDRMPFDELQRRVKEYVEDCESTKCYIKNFTTFLNTLDPDDPGESSHILLDQTDTFGNNWQ